MPLFEYRCLVCANEFELLIRAGVEPRCPSCGGASLERLLSMFGVSSEASTARSRQKLGAQQRQKSQASQKEREFYKHDHHDD
jgi:putative FmdB family regulatory protein